MIERMPSARALRAYVSVATLALVGSLAIVSSAHAGDQSNTGDSPGAPSDQGTDITVTALRRDTTVQTTPLAITALSAQTLTKAGVVSAADYAKLVPSLRVQDGGPGQQRISIRGIQASGEPTVGVYYDETPVAGSVGVSSDAAGRTADFTLFDLDRIEVLRGPQGTLYGASSMGGAIRVIYAKPKQDYEGAVEGQLSSTNGSGGVSYFVNGMINLPLIKDLLAVRAVLYRRDSAGYIDDTFLNRKDVNNYTSTGGRLMARVTPASNLTVDLMGTFENTDAVSSSFNPALGRYTSAAQVNLPYTDRSNLYSSTVKWDLGGVNLTSVSSYQKRRSAYAADDSYYIASYRNASNCASYVNGSASAACSPAQLSTYYNYVDSLGPAAIYYPGTTKDFTQELRISSDGHHFIDWTAGFFYESRKNNVTSEDALADKTTGEIIFPNQLIYRRQIADNLKQYAGFGEATLHATNRLALTAGLRVFKYDKIVSGFTDIAWTLIGAPARPVSTVNSSESGTLLKFNAAYTLNSNVMFYASASQGYRPGGANQVIGLSTDLVAYKSDRLWDYEGGAKLTLLDRKMTLNVDAFQIDWTNMQVSGRTLNGAFSFLSNAGAARIRGAELEAAYRPVKGLSFNLATSFLNAKLTQDQISSVITAPGRAGDRIPYIPFWSGSLGSEYTRPISATTDLFLRADTSYMGASWSEFRPTNVYRIRVRPYTLVNLRAGLEFKTINTGVYLFLNNVFNVVAINRASMSSTANSYSATAAAPRTVGLNLRRTF